MDALDNAMQNLVQQKNNQLCELSTRLDFAMKMVLHQKRNQLWQLSARMDNAMIETFQRNGLEPEEHIEIDKYSGFGNCKLKAGVEDKLCAPNSKELSD